MVEVLAGFAAFTGALGGIGGIVWALTREPKSSRDERRRLAALDLAAREHESRQAQLALTQQEQATYQQFLEEQEHRHEQ